MTLIGFLKEWTLPTAIVAGCGCYFAFSTIEWLQPAGAVLGPFFASILPVCVFLTLLITFCKVDFHSLRPRRWHFQLLMAQLLMIAALVGIIRWAGDNAQQRLLWESALTCVIAPCAAAAPVVTGKLGGNLNSMVTFTLVSSLAAALLIPIVFPMLEKAEHITFLAAFFVILRKLAVVLVLPLAMAYVIRHHLHRLHRWITSRANLGFYTWAFTLSINAGVIMHNITTSHISGLLLLLIAGASLLMCGVQFGVGRAIGKRHGEAINAGQGMFQKNTALTIWVSYIYLNPVASVGAGCYVLWQNIINSIELWHHDHHRKP